MNKKSALWGAVGLLWLGFLVRAHNILALPPFNDESLHIRRAETVWTFDDPVLSFTIGKLLTYYWQGLFNPDRLDAVFVARTVTGLFALLGLAAAFAVGRRLFGATAGVLGLYLLVFAPFTVFFDRMALSDPLTAALGMLTIWASLLMLDRPQEWEWGLLTGIMALLTILAKLTGVIFATMPIVAIAILAQGSWRARWQRYRTTLLVCYATLIAFLMPFILWIVYREASGNRISVVDNHLINHKSPLETLTDNFRELWDAALILNHPLFIALVVLMVALACFRRWRVMLFALACVGLAWGMPVAMSGVFSVRYLQIGVLPFFVLIGGALIWAVPKNIPSPWLIGWGIASLWIVFFAQPFLLNSWNDPRQNDYPEPMRWEYFSNFTTGYGLMDAAAVLPSMPPSSTSGKVPVIGLTGSCHQMRLYLDETDVFLECPAFGWNGEFMDDVAEYVEARMAQESVLYLLVEPRLPYTNLSKLRVNPDVLFRFARPFDGLTVELWRVYPVEG